MTYATMSSSSSNNTGSVYEQHKLSGEPVKFPVQAQRWVHETANITKPVIRDKQARGREDQSSKAIKIWRVLLESSSDGE